MGVSALVLADVGRVLFRQPGMTPEMKGLAYNMITTSRTWSYHHHGRT
jgi:hypothetical protein